MLGAGTTLGVVAMTVALWPSLRGTGFRWRLTGGWSHPGIRRIVRLSGWVVVYVAANQARLHRDHRARGRHLRRLATRSTRRRSSSSCCRTRSSRSRSSPRCCRRWPNGGATDDLAGVRERFSLGLRDTIVVIVPAAFAFLVLAEPIVSLLLRYGCRHAGRRDPDRPHPAGLRAGAAVLLGVPADHPHVLRHAGQPHARTRQHRRGDRDDRRSTCCSCARSDGTCPASRWATPSSYVVRDRRGARAAAPRARLPRRPAGVRPRSRAPCRRPP